MLDDPPYRRYTGATGDDHKLLIAIKRDIEAISVGSAQEKAIACPVLKNRIGHLAHLADCKVNGAVADTADRDGRLTEFGQRYLKKLPPASRPPYKPSGRYTQFLCAG